MKWNLYQQVDILFSILEELLSSPFNKQFDDKAKRVLSKHGLEVVEGKIIKTQRRVSAEAKESGYGESDDERIRKEIIAILQYKYEKFSKDPKYCNAPQWIAWLEKQGKCETDCHSNHQDANHPNGCITLEDFNGGEGFYKVHLDYLNEKQVEEIEEMIRTWNKESKVPNENIKSCIGMCLTDVGEQRFKDYNTSLKDCLAWLEKQGCQKPFNYECANIPQKDFSPSIGIEIPFGAKDSELQGATYLIPEGFHAEIKDNKVLIKKGKQKPAEWHIEDEQNLNACLGYIPDEFLRRWLTNIIHVKHDKPAWTIDDDEEFEIAITALKGAEQYDSAVWLITLKQRIRG